MEDGFSNPRHRITTASLSGTLQYQLEVFERTWLPNVLNTCVQRFSWMELTKIKKKQLLHYFFEYFLLTTTDIFGCRMVMKVIYKNHYKREVRIYLVFHSQKYSLL